jgi:fluoroquinolone transport system permease protein
MIALKALKALGPIDYKNIRRDPLLQWMVFTPLFMLAAVRWLVPWLAARLEVQFGFDLAAYYPLLMSMITMAVPLIIGVVIGFLLLDQRDDHTLEALQVTPLSLDGYLVYRVAMPTLVAFLGTILVVWGSRLVDLDGLGVLMASLAAAPYAPILALFYASLAQNKVQGLALNKASGVILLPALVAYFIEPPWQYLFGLAPTYWPAKLFWTLAAGESYAAFYMLASLITAAGLLLLALNTFKKVMHR